MAYTNPLLVKNNPSLFNSITFGLDWLTDEQARSELSTHFRLQEMVYDDIEEMKIAIQDIADHKKDYLNRLYDLQLANLEYEPAENYNMVEEETPAEQRITHTPAETTVTTNPVEQTVTTTPAETTTTSTPAEQTTNSQNDVWGFNSTTQVPHDVNETDNTVQNPQTDIYTTQQPGTVKNETDNAGTVATVVDDNEITINEVIEKRTLTRHGNIGVTTGAQMLTGEIDLAEVIWNLLDIFCAQFDDLFCVSFDLW